jgi:hypothetical protein
MELSIPFFDFKGISFRKMQQNPRLGKRKRCRTQGMFPDISSLPKPLFSLGVKWAPEHQYIGARGSPKENRLVPAPGALFRLPKALSKMFSDKHKLTGCADIGTGIIDKRPHFGRKRVKISFHPGIFIFHSHHPGIVCPKP